MKTHLMLAFILGVLISGCIQPPSGQETKYVCTDGRVVADKTSCPTTQATGAQTSAGSELTLETELLVCSEMPSLQTNYQTVSLEDFCVIGLAAKHANTTLCKKVSSDRRKDCYSFVAEVSSKPDLCTEAGAQRDMCYEQYARDFKDISVCDKISDIGYKDSCYSGLSNTLGDATICEKIRNANQKDSCYGSMASRFSDSSYCQKIMNTNQKQNCLQNMQQGMMPVQKY
jgi:hypothetical protein